MLDKSLEEEPAPRVDERLARIVQIIVEQYDGNVNTFVESNRYRIEANWNQTSKGVYEKQKNLSEAKINRDAYAEWTAGRVVATPTPQSDRVGPAPHPPRAWTLPHSELLAHAPRRRC